MPLQVSMVDRLQNLERLRKQAAEAEKVEELRLVLSKLIDDAIEQMRWDIERSG